MNDAPPAGCWLPERSRVSRQPHSSLCWPQADVAAVLPLFSLLWRPLSPPTRTSWGWVWMMGMGQKHSVSGWRGRDSTCVLHARVLSVTPQCTGLATRGLVDRCGVVVGRRVCVHVVVTGACRCNSAYGDIKGTKRWHLVLDQGWANSSFLIRPAKIEAYIYLQ